MGFFEIRLIDLYLILTFFAMAVVLLAVSFFPKNRKPENTTLTLILGLFASHLTLIALNHMGWLPNQMAMRTGYTFNLCYGPLFYLYFQKAWRGQSPWQSVLLWAILGLTLPLFHLGGAFYQALLVLSFMYHLALSLQLFLSKEQPVQALGWHKFALGFFCLLSLTYSLEMMLLPATQEVAWQMRFIYFSELMILVVGFLFHSLHNPVNFLHIRMVNTRQKEERLAGSDTELSMIIKTMEQGQLYQNPVLNRGTFEDLTGLSINRISELINVSFGINFSEWVNGYRIEEAKSLLSARPDLSIKEVYYTTGFNSKSAFYTAFKKQVGQTPTQYRQDQNMTQKAA